MIVDLPGCSSKDISKRLVRLRSEVGAVTLGRVLTLLIVVDDKDADLALDAATEASRAHPSRIIAVVRGDRRGAPRMDAQLRMGGQAGASEVIVLRLYGELADHGEAVVTPLLLADSPIVAWWPVSAGDQLADTPIGRMAQRRITDASLSSDPRGEIERRSQNYADGDTDMGWARTTRWRALLAAALDLPPYEPVGRAVVTGASDSASTDLLAGWLAARLKCPVERVRTRRGVGIVSVRLERSSGPVDLVRDESGLAQLNQPGQPVRRVGLDRPDTAESLSEELRRLDTDEEYRAALVNGLPKVIEAERTASEVARAGEAPAPTEVEPGPGRPPEGKGASSTPDEAAALDTPPERKAELLDQAGDADEDGSETSDESTNGKDRR